MRKIGKKLRDKARDTMVRTTLSALSMVEFEQALACTIHIATQERRILDSILLTLLLLKCRTGKKLRSIFGGRRGVVNPQHICYNYTKKAKSLSSKESRK